MVRAVDQGAIERATDDDQRAIGGANDGVRSDGLCERWIRSLQKERRIVKAMDQRAKGGAMYGASG